MLLRIAAQTFHLNYQRYASSGLPRDYYTWILNWEFWMCFHKIYSLIWFVRELWMSFCKFSASYTANQFHVIDKTGLCAIKQRANTRSLLYLHSTHLLPGNQMSSSCNYKIWKRDFICIWSNDHCSSLEVFHTYFLWIWKWIILSRMLISS